MFTGFTSWHDRKAWNSHFRKLYFYRLSIYARLCHEYFKKRDKWKKVKESLTLLCNKKKLIFYWIPNDAKKNQFASFCLHFFLLIRYSKHAPLFLHSSRFANRRIISSIHLAAVAVVACSKICCPILSSHTQHNLQLRPPASFSEMSSRETNSKPF